MPFRNYPIQRKLMTIVLGTSIVVLLLTCSAFLAYEVITFRRSSVRQLSTLGEVIALNSTAVLAFESAQDATEVLSALRAERHIVGAALYDRQGRLFARYPAGASTGDFPATPQADGYRFEDGFLIGFTPVAQIQDTRLGTLYLRSDLEALRERLRLYGGIAALIVVAVTIVAYALSRKLQQQISRPIQALAEAAEAVSLRRDYAVRAQLQGPDELGVLTTAFNHMLEQIQAKNAELESRVRARTIELEAANKELEAFAYSVSHDLRTPLRAITGFAELMLRQPAAALGPESRRSVQLIHRGCCEMDQLINSILAFSRLGHQALDRQTVDLAQMCRLVFEELRPAFAGRQIDFRVEVLPRVSGSPELLRQVIANLLDNALKFSRPRQLTRIEIGALPPKIGPDPVFYVRDNGVGFDMEQSARLFGVFQRLHSASEFEGSGVGLAMVRRIIERHGGRVWAEGQPEQGATIYFTLPAAPAG